MTPKFARHVETLRRRLRHRVMVRAWSWTILVFIAVVFSLGALDYVLRFQERGLRFLATGTLLATTVWCFFRIVKPAMTLCIDRVALARWLEKFQGGAPISLAAACDLVSLPPDDLRWGSPALRSMAIEQAEAHWTVPPWREVIERGPALWPGYLAAAALVVAFSLLLVFPVVAGTALIRLVNPLSDLSYPQTTHLVVVHYPERLSRGDTFFLQVTEERGQLPDEVRIAIRPLDGESHRAVNQLMKKVRNQFVFRQENVRTSFQFLITGGDDRSQPWRRVEVVDPPQVSEWKVWLKPPEYTGWPPEEARGPLRALAGTEVQLSGRANRPLKRVVVDCGPQQSFQGDVLPDQYSFRVPGGKNHRPEQERWILQTSGYYRIRLEAADGTFSVNEPRWEVRVYEDAPPTVVLESGQRLLVMTPDGRLPLRVSARDDLAIRQINLVSRDSSGNSLGPTIPLYQGPPFPPTQIRMAELETHADSVEKEYLFRLPVSAGNTGLTFRVVASVEDYKGQASESEPLEIRVISPDEFNQRLASEEEKLLQQLAQLYESFVKISRDWERLSEKLRAEKRLSRTEANQLLTLDTLERQAFRRIADPGLGILYELQDLAGMAEYQGVTQDRVERLKKFRTDLEASWKQHGVPAESQLGMIANWARNLVERLLGDEQSLSIEKEWADVAQNADQFSLHQAAWEKALEGLLQNVSGIRLVNTLRRELEKLLTEQLELIQQTRDLGQQTLGRALQDLTPNEQDALTRIARRQTLLATKLEELVAKVLGGLQQSGNQDVTRQGFRPHEGSMSEREDDLTIQSSQMVSQQGAVSQQSFEKPKGDAVPKEPQLIALIIDRINGHGLTALMRQAGLAIEQNRLSEGLTLEEQSAEILRELIDLLDGKREDAGRRQQDLAEQENELRNLLRAQQDLIRKFAEARQTAVEEALSTFIREQSKIEQRTRELADQMAPPLKRVAEPLLKEAIRRMQDAQTSARQKDVGKTEQNATLAQGLMEQALEAVGQERITQERNKAYDRWHEFVRRINGIISEQRNLLRKTQSLDIEKRKSQTPERLESWKKTVLELGRAQDALGQQVAQLERDIREAPVIAAILTRVEEATRRAAKYLVGLECGVSTQEAQRMALSDLQLIARAIQGESSQVPPSSAEQGTQPNAGDDQGPQSPRLVFLAPQIKLLRDLQASINQRTESLEKRRSQPGENPGALEEESERLSHEQALVLSLVMKLRDDLLGSASPEKSRVTGPAREGAETPPATERQPNLPKPGQPGSVRDLFNP